MTYDLCVLQLPIYFEMLFVPRKSSECSCTNTGQIGKDQEQSSSCPVNPDHAHEEPPLQEGETRGWVWLEYAFVHISVSNQ